VEKQRLKGSALPPSDLNKAESERVGRIRSWGEIKKRLEEEYDLGRGLKCLLVNTLETDPHKSEIH